LLRGKESVREIARRLGRSPSTISRELRRNADEVYYYRATTAHARAHARAARPKTAKLKNNEALRKEVEKRLGQKDSPVQIAGRLRKDHPNNPEMWVSHETIYQSLYLESRGGLKRELVKNLRTGRTLRKPQRRPDERRGRLQGMVMIADRPAEVEDRGISMFLSSRLSSDSCDWFLVGCVVAEHGPEDVDAAPGESDEGLFM
jgi:IS30 family transposase